MIVDTMFVHGYGHNSIVRGVCEKQLELCQTWMNVGTLAA